MPHPVGGAIGVTLSCAGLEKGIHPANRYTSKKVTITRVIRCKHYIAIASSQAGQV